MRCIVHGGCGAGGAPVAGGPRFRVACVRVCVGARVSCSVVRTFPTVVLGDCFPNLLLRARGCPQGASVADWWRGMVSPFSCTMPAAGHLAVWK